MDVTSPLEQYVARWIRRITAWDQELSTSGPTPALEAAVEDLRSCRTLEEAQMAAEWWRDGYEAARIDPSAETWAEMQDPMIEPPELARRARGRADDCSA